jgi:hypothetical protein
VSRCFVVAVFIIQGLAPGRKEARSNETWNAIIIDEISLHGRYTDIKRNLDPDDEMSLYLVLLHFAMY